jgi:hypothetical protein
MDIAIRDTGLGRQLTVPGQPVRHALPRDPGSAWQAHWLGIVQGRSPDGLVPSRHHLNFEFKMRERRHRHDSFKERVPKNVKLF